MTMTDDLMASSTQPVQIDHSSRDSLRRRAVSQLQNGDVDDAIRSGLSSYRITKTLAALAPVPGQRYSHDILPECLLLGKAYAQSQQAERAAFYLEQATAIADEKPYPEVATNAALHSIVAELYMLLGLSDEAEKMYNKYKNAVEEGYGLNHLATSDCYNLLGAFYTHHGRYEPALLYCNRALTIRVALLGPRHQNTSDSHYNLGLLYRLNGDPHDARAAFKSARDVRIDCFGEESLEVAEVDVSAGFTDHQLGRLEDAATSYGHAYAIRKHHLGEFHPDTEEALSLLQAARRSLGLEPIDEDDLQLRFDLSQMTKRPPLSQMMTTTTVDGGGGYNAKEEEEAQVKSSTSSSSSSSSSSLTRAAVRTPLRNVSRLVGVSSSSPSREEGGDNRIVAAITASSSPVTTRGSSHHKRRATAETIPLTLSELEGAIDAMNQASSKNGGEVAIPPATRARMMRGAASTPLTPQMFRDTYMYSVTKGRANLLMESILKVRANGGGGGGGSASGGGTSGGGAGVLKPFSLVTPAPPSRVSGAPSGDGNGSGGGGSISNARKSLSIS